MKELKDQNDEKIKKVKTTKSHPKTKKEIWYQRGC